MKFSDLTGKSETAQIIRAGLSDNGIRTAWDISLRDYDVKDVVVEAKINGQRASVAFIVNGEEIMFSAFNMP